MTAKSDGRIAIVGAGLIGRKHIDVVARCARLDAIIDPDPKSRDVADRLRVPWYADLDRYLATCRPDGAIIASPNGLHRNHGCAFLDAGVPVLIEKPLADSVAAARALETCAAETGVSILVGHHRRHSDIVRAAKACIDGGRLGRLVTANAMFWLNKPDDYFDVAWRGKPGGGPTYINLIHDIDLLRHFCGEIETVQARESHDVRNLEVEDAGAVIVAFANGVLGTVSICDAVSAPWSWELTSGENPVYPKTDQSCYLLGGTEGALSLPDLRLWRHSGKQSWWAPMVNETLVCGANDPIVEQFRHFLDIIENGTRPVVSASDGRRNIEALAAIKAAASHGGTQSIGRW